MSISDEIKRLHELHLSGALTDAEFAQAKEKLLAAIGSGTPASGPDESLSQLNQFRRSKSDQWLGGICGGLGKITGLESWIWRLIFVLFTFYFGVGVVAYVLAWIFVPEEE
ncbi:MAG: PspC domain-containing protein [Pseudomonadota bacterium]